MCCCLCVRTCRYLLLLTVVALAFLYLGTLLFVPSLLDQSWTDWLGDIAQRKTYEELHSIAEEWHVPRL